MDIEVIKPTQEGFTPVTVSITLDCEEECRAFHAYIGGVIPHEIQDVIRNSNYSERLDVQGMATTARHLLFKIFYSFTEAATFKGKN